MTKISRFTSEIVPISQRVTGDGDESAAPEGGGRFADYALVSLHCLRIYLDTSYRMTIDLLREMLQITGEIGLDAADLPSPSTLCKAFDRISMSICRVLLRQSAQLHNPSKHASIDATFYERSAASHHYCQRISYRVQKLKVTKLVDTVSQAVLDVHCSTTREGSDADLAEQIARRNAVDLGLKLPTKATTSKHSAKHCVNSASDISSSTASSLPMTTRITPESTNNATINAL